MLIKYYEFYKTMLQKAIRKASNKPLTRQYSVVIRLKKDLNKVILVTEVSQCQS